MKNIGQAQCDEAIVIALGSSLAGDWETRQALLDQAKNAFPAFGIQVWKSSRWWSSEAWPDPSQPGYLNGIVLARTTLAPEDLMAALLAIETRFGRCRAEPNSPRTLDLDLIAYGRRILIGPDLILPHPRAHQRLFVMGPLAEILPQWRHPASSDRAINLARSSTIGTDAVPLEGS